jgi:viologen exporter family transport system permease protein
MNVALLDEPSASERASRRSKLQAVRAPTLRGALIGCGALVGATLRTAFAYRTATLFAVFVGLLGQSVFLWVWLAVYRENPPPSALPERELFSYLIVALVFNAMCSLSVEFRFGQRVRQGLIANDLIRPLGFLPFQLAQAAGDALANLLFALPIYVVGLAFVGRAALPANGACATLGVLSLALAFVINFGLSYVLIEVSLITHSTYGTVTARLALHQAFSGLAAPLSLFPAALRDIAVCLPFRDIIATPAQIWLGLQPAPGLAEALLRQACWASALLLIGGVMFPTALARHQLQGG